MSAFQTTLEFVVVLFKTLGLILVSAFRNVIPEPLKSVREKVVLVTGSGGGLGRLLAEKFALLGAKVVLVDVNEANNKETLKMIRKMGCKAWAYACDVGDEAQVEELSAKVQKEVGAVDILLNNAGVLNGKPLLEMSEQQIRKTLDVNVLAHIWMVRQFLPRMLERSDGHIVAISSVAGVLGCTYLVDYCASKHAVVGMMSALREELNEMGREDQIKLTVILPCAMNTTLIEKPKTRFPFLLPILDVNDVSEIVVNSVLREKRFVVIPTLAHTILRIANLFPAQVPILLQRFLGHTMDPNVK